MQGEADRSVEAPEALDPALRIEVVSHSFGSRRALDDVSLEVPRGRFTALLGVNGAGKTTLFNLVTRLYANRRGRILVCGHDVQQHPREALARMGVVFQSRSLDGTLSVRQNFLYQGALHGLPRREVLRRGEEALARMSLSALFDRKVATLSGGEARRVEIARALLHRPALLLCDEATVGLDVRSRADIVADMHRLARDEGAGILWATHLIDEIAPDDPVVVLHQGRVLARGAASEIAGEGGLSETFLALTGRRAA